MIGPDRSRFSAAGGIAGYPDVDHALAALRGLMADPMNRMRIRAMLAEELSGTDIGRMHDHEVLDLVASRMVAGTLRLAAIPLRPAPVGPSLSRQEEEEDVAPAAVLEDRSTWIGIQLIDAEDQPVPDVRYRLTMPNGNVKNGHLDADGKARVVLSQDGTCEVCFPELDQDAWVPVL